MTRAMRGDDVHACVKCVARGVTERHLHRQPTVTATAAATARASARAPASAARVKGGRSKRMTRAMMPRAPHTVTSDMRERHRACHQSALPSPPPPPPPPTARLRRTACAGRDRPRPMLRSARGGLEPHLGGPGRGIEPSTSPMYRRRPLGPGGKTILCLEEVTHTRRGEATESTGPGVEPPVRLVEGWFGGRATPTPARSPIGRLDRSNRTIDYTFGSAHSPKKHQ